MQKKHVIRLTLLSFAMSAAFVIVSGVDGGLPKMNVAKFSQKYAQGLKSVASQGSTEIFQVESWTWKFSGKIYGDFHQFDDNTAINISIGDFNSDDYFLAPSIGGAKASCDGTFDPNGKKKYGKYRIAINKGDKNAGQLAYYFISSYTLDKPNGNSVDIFKGNGGISLKWDENALTFSLTVHVSPSDNYNGTTGHGLACAIQDLNDPSSVKPLTVTQKVSGTIPCQVRFGNALYLNTGMGYSGKQSAALVFKGPNDMQDQYVLQSHSIKEIDSTSELLPPPLAVPVNDSPKTNYMTSVDIAVTDNDITEIMNGSVYVSGIVQQPDHGTVVVSDDMQIVTYTPDPIFTGIDTFTYSVFDDLGRPGANHGTVFVYVGVDNTNASPIAVADTATIAMDDSANIDVLSNDSDPNSDDLSIVSVSKPLHGSAYIDGDTINYQPDPEFFGTDTFSYTVSNGNGGTDSAVVTVTVQ